LPVYSADVNGDEGKQTTVPATAPPDTAGNAPAEPTPSSKARRISLWAGLLLALAGVFLVGDTASRLELALSFAGQWWAWALLGLAAVNIAMSVIRLESLLAPALLIAVAVIGLAIQNGVATSVILNFVLPAVLVLMGVALLNATRKPTDRSWTRILLTGRVQATHDSQGVLRPRAFLGEVRANLRPLGSAPEHDIEIHVTAIFGHVRLEIPADWNLKPAGNGTLLAPVLDPMLNGTGDREINLRVLGFCGIVTVARH
jgi:hypothetical protein